MAPTKIALERTCMAVTAATAPTLLITGGTPLSGSVRVGGAKNASYKLMVASLLADTESRLLNIPDIADVALTTQVISHLGARVHLVGNKTIAIDPDGMSQHAIGTDYGAASRASTMFIPSLLAKFGEAVVPLPGGDKIGKRPLERHMLGLEKMGVRFEQKDGSLHCKTSGLVGTTYRFTKNTHTGTETLILAAVKASGKTILENAGLEPEIDDLIQYLNAMGARVRRRAFRVIEIEGVSQLHGAIHRIMPDRNEAVSYACAALATKGDVILENARRQDMDAFLEKLAEAGGGYEVGDYGIRFYYTKPLVATDIETATHPGFMTDWQPLWATMICHAHGTSIIHETISQNRFQYVAMLRQMGAKITEFTPEVVDPEKTYNFNWSDRLPTDVRAIRIEGPTQFTGGEFTVPDLRAGATVLLAALSGTGTVTLHGIDQIERGYEDISEKLQLLGANITRV